MEQLSFEFMNEKPVKFTPFEMGYVECLFWSSVDQNDAPLEANYSIIDLSSEAITKIKQDCDFFIEKAGALLDEISDSQAGHDFWLTRNRHGAGFWDRGIGEIGEALTDICHDMGELDAYVGNDGKVYIL